MGFKDILIGVILTIVGEEQFDYSPLINAIIFVCILFIFAAMLILYERNKTRRG